MLRVGTEAHAAHSASVTFERHRFTLGAGNPEPDSLILGRTGKYITFRWKFDISYNSLVAGNESKSAQREYEGRSPDEVSNVDQKNAQKMCILKERYL